MKQISTLSDKKSWWESFSFLAPQKAAIALSALLILQGCWKNEYTEIETETIDLSSLQQGEVHYWDNTTLNCNNPFWLDTNLDIIPWGIRINYWEKSGTPNDTREGNNSGWISTICPLPEAPDNARAFSIHYTLEIPEDFDGGKGMKLFGWCAQDCPRGGEAEAQEWNSIRLHSYKRGSKHIFATYIYGQQQISGQQEYGSTQNSNLQVTPGKHEVEIFIDYSIGKVIVKIWNREIYDQTREDFIIPYSQNSQTQWNLFLSSFYGWDASWGPKKDTHIDITDLFTKYYY